MLGDITPRSIQIDQQAVVYPGRDHVSVLTIKRFDGRRYQSVDVSLLTRVVLAFPGTDPVIVYDSSVTAGVISWAGSAITVDLSDFSMPASIQPCYLIAYDAEHTNGQVLVDNNDSVLAFDFRNISAVGIVQPPVIELISEAPADGATYGRKNGTWVGIDAVVAGVSSVNGLTGTVVLTAANVGADAAGTAAAAITTHEADTTPHPVITQINKAGFNTAAGLTAGEGEMVWNAADATVDIGLPGGVTLQSGQEFLIRGLNNSGVTMVDGTAVYISGASGNRVVFTAAQANQPAADKTIGVLTQDILNNQEGFCTIAGLVRGLNTSAWAEGSELWLSAATPGAITNIKPPAPNNAVRVGVVVRSHLTIGSIFVRVQIIESINELHNVNITAPNDGDILEYDTTSSTWLNVPNTGGAGEANTASNLGTGVGVFAQKVAADLQFKSIVAGANITLTPSATGVTIAAAGGGGAVDSVNGQTGVVVLNTDNIAEGVTNLYFTNGRASAAAPVQTVDGQTGAVVLTSSYAPLSHVGDTGAAHGAATTVVNGFMTTTQVTKLDGIATGANNYVHPNHSGDVTSVGDGAQTIANNAVTNAKAADMAVNTIKGRITAGTGDPEDLTATQVRTIINVADGANAYVHPNHSGDVTSVGDGAQTIAANAVTNTKLADMATQTLKGRTTAGTGDPEDLTAAQARTLLNVANGATALPAVATFTGNKSLALADINTYNVSQDATAQVVTLPAQATVAWTADAEIHVERGGTGSLTVTGATGVTINGVSAGSFTLSAQFAAATLKRKGSDSWTLVGGLTSSVVTGPASSGDGNIALFNGTTGKVIKDGGVVTTAGLALLDDANAAAQRTTLGVGTGDSPTFTALTLTNGQIAFPATQVPSANANTLDDYEEGTWTPTLTFATPGDLVVVTSVNSGFYTKNGRECKVSFTLATSTFTHTTASGSLRFTGIPFTSLNAAGNTSMGGTSWQGITKAGFTDAAALVAANSNNIEVFMSRNGGGRDQVFAADMPSGGSVIIQATIMYTT